MADIVQAVPEETRPRTIPIWDTKYTWWSDAVKRELTARGWKQVHLAEKLGVGEYSVSRCITRKGATVDLAIRISDLLKIPYPVFLPESEAEAAEMMERRSLAQQAAAHRKNEEEVLELRRLLAERDRELMRIHGNRSKRRRRAG